MATYNTTNALQNVIDLLLAENEALKNGLVVSVAGISADVLENTVDIADHETRVTAQAVTLTDHETRITVLEP